MDPYETLGLNRDASPADVKRAYRRKAKQTHPDTGGDAKAFQSVELAHRILSDDEARRKYDTTGKFDDGPDNDDAQAISIIAGMLDAVLDDEKAKFRDLVGEMRKRIEGDIRTAETSIKQGKAFVTRTLDLQKRFKSKTGRNLFKSMIASKIAEAERIIVGIEGEIATRKRALELLADEDFNFEKAKPADYGNFTTADMMRALDRFPKRRQGYGFFGD